MIKIPSTEKTNDFIYRLKIRSGTPLHDTDNPHMLVFEEFVEPASLFHSMDVTILRDGKRANDVEFLSFEHLREPDMTYIKFRFCDKASRVSSHDYLLTVVLRYLV